VTVIDRDRGWRAIKREVERAMLVEVAVGILHGGKSSDGVSIAEYAAHNEFGTSRIPSRPFMAMSFDENLSDINADFMRQSKRC